MNTFDNLYSSKSVREFNGGQISDQQLAEILKAAEAAPVAMGSYEKYHITVVQDKSVLSAVSENAAKMFGSPDLDPLYGAPTLIVVSAQTDEDGQVSPFDVSSAAIVDYNMIIAAVELGLGNCPIWGAISALKGAPDVTAKLGIPEGFAPCCAVALGTTDDSYAPRDIDMAKIGVNTVA